MLKGSGVLSPDAEVKGGDVYLCVNPQSKYLPATFTADER